MFKHFVTVRVQEILPREAFTSQHLRSLEGTKTQAPRDREGPPRSEDDPGVSFVSSVTQLSGRLSIKQEVVKKVAVTLQCCAGCLCRC